MRLIINIDDLGLHPAVTRAVIDGAAKGLITSASVLANGPDLDDVAARAAYGAFDEISLGAHLNILRGAPLSNPGDIPTLLDRKGCFLGSYLGLYYRYTTGRLALDEVACEWKAQIEYLRDHGIKITHLDSEKHIHAWPHLMALAQETARLHGISWVRRPLEPTLPFDWSRGAMKARLLRIWCANYSHVEINSTDAVWGIANQGAPTAAQFERRIADYGDAEIIEAILHPGSPEYGDPVLPASYGNLTVVGRWNQEKQALLNSGWPDMLRAKQITLTNFRDVRLPGRCGGG